MSQLATHPDSASCEVGPGPLGRVSSTSLFAAAMLILACTAAFLAGWAPLGFSIVIVFLFAGPHNWIEARYFLSRMPGRWGRLRSYFLLGFGGVLVLTGVFAAMTWMGREWSGETWFAASALWNSALVGWILTLIHMRSRQNPRRDWFWTLPIGFLLLAGTWLSPQLWSLGLVYLHPLIALWILDRETRATAFALAASVPCCLTCVPVLLGVLWWQLADAPPLPGNDALSERIAQHAGAGPLSGVPPHLLIATHTFLEMLHYSVWLIAIPLVSLGSTPWQLGAVPLARRSRLWHWALAAFLATGAVLVLVLWAGFLADYGATRDIYFTLALAHVLAEVPFLLRAL